MFRRFSEAWSASFALSFVLRDSADVLVVVVAVRRCRLMTDIVSGKCLSVVAAVNRGVQKTKKVGDCRVSWIMTL